LGIAMERVIGLNRSRCSLIKSKSALKKF
jgi:hypothetical protein